MRISIFGLSKEAYLRLKNTYGVRIFSDVKTTSEGEIEVLLNENVIVKITNYLYIDLGGTVETVKKDEFYMVEVF